MPSVTKEKSLTDYIIGECMEMCPKDEIMMREREKLLHVLEMVPGTEKNKKPSADKSRMVKSFSRSAAGKHMLDSKHLRPPDMLLKTLNYLFDNIITNDRVPWCVTYDFLVDRLRSVRQDMVIQNASRAHCISLLQPIIRFHAYASYRLCEENISNFDPHLNNTHLQECLKRLLCIYDDCDDFFKNSSDNDIDPINQYLLNHRPQFESLYLLMNLGSATALSRGLILAQHWRTNLVDLSVQISMACLKNNFVRTCNLMKNLPPLHFALASLHLPSLRRKALKIMSVAYNSKNLRFPTETLKDMLLFNTVEQVTAHCKCYGLKCNNDSVHFLKSDFNDSKSTMPLTHVNYIDEKLAECDLSVLMLYGF